MAAVESVLLVDDDPAMLDGLSALCGVLGISRVCQTSSAEEALEILQRDSFSLILSDYRLEGLSGVDLVTTIREQGIETPVILLSGAPDKTGVIKAVQHPRVDFFTKPFAISDLEAAMRRLTQLPASSVM